MENYECYHKLGRGKYSEVYQGCNVKNGLKCIVKILKPVKVEKIYREVKILQSLFGGPNIVRMYDLLRDPVSKTPCPTFRLPENMSSQFACNREKEPKDVLKTHPQIVKKAPRG